MVRADNSLITVIISTRNRGASILAPLRTILLCEYPDFELRIVDQSDDDVTRISLQPFLDDPRITYISTAGRGVAAGRNLAISGARSELIAVTDDDCEIPSNWLREMFAAFALDRRIGLVFGNVLSGPCDPKAGFIMAYVRESACLARDIGDKHLVEGVAACMGLRKSVWEQLGGFDEMLGAGAPFKSAEETDLAIRTLLAGNFVYETPRLTVIHHGFHPWTGSKPLFQGYLYGIGAMLAKNLKCGYWAILKLLFHLAWRWAFQRPVVTFGCLPPRGLRLAAFVGGLKDGALAPVDRSTGHFKRKGKPAPEA
jgi:GT2 family glycosyltransferase